MPNVALMVIHKEKLVMDQFLVVMGSHELNIQVATKGHHQVGDML